MRKQGIYSSHRKISPTIIAAAILLPFVTKRFESIKTNIEAYAPALDIYYYQRIFSRNENYLQLGNIYVDSENYQYRQINVLSIGELLQKSLYHLLDNNIIATYYLFSLLILFSWLFLITRLLADDFKLSQIRSLLFTSTLLIGFFGYNNFVNTNYSFARIISPQISVLLWLIGLKLITKLVSLRNAEKPNLKYIGLFQLLVLVASFTYLYTFMSLFAANIIILIVYAIKKDIASLIWLMFMSLISSTPFFLINYFKSREERFKDAGERMGLINYNFIGSFQTLMICLGVSLLVLALKHFSKVKRQYTNLELSLLISTSGIIAASQSNLITGREIQFYHFDLFAKTNLMISVLLILSRVKLVATLSQITRYRTPSIVLITGTLMLNSVISTYGPLLSYSQNHSPAKFVINRYSEVDSLIVDVINLQNNFSVYSKAKLLYQSDITTYGFTNREVLARAYISGGCPNQLGKELRSEIEVYRFEAINQKASSLKKFIDYLEVDFLFSDLYKSTLEAAYREINSIELEINDFLISVSGISCITLAKSYGINYVIYDNDSEWKLIANKNGLLVNSFKQQNLNLYELKI